jgi:hypothetical protein
MERTNTNKPSVIRVERSPSKSISVSSNIAAQQILIK